MKNIDYENYLSQNYKTSKDYELLFELVHKERVICYVPYKSNSKTKDVCQSQVLPIDGYISIGSRGIEYISAMNNFNGKTLKEDFIQQCQEIDLEFVCRD